MLTWFHKQRCNNVLISGPVLKTKAEHFALQLGIIDFKASEGWLGKFKQRHNITYGKISGEALNVDLNVTNSWLINVWPKLNEKYTPDNIFNADETGIFYKMTPDKALNFKGEKSVGGKLSKERITAFVAANMSGTEKRKITVIGKSKNPRCFKNIKRLPVTVANKSAWMTSILFEEEIRKWDAELKGRKVLLLVNIQNYVEMDENLVTTISLTDEEILNAVTKGEEEQKEDEDEEAQPDEVVIPSIQQALDAAKLLEKYLFHEDDPKLSQNMGEIHRKIQKQYWQNKKVQTKMTDYLK